MKNENTQTAKAGRGAKHAGRVLSALLAGVAVFMLLAVASCDTGTSWQAVQDEDKTVTLTLCGESLSLVCPQALLEDSQDRMTNDVIPSMEVILNLDPSMKSNFISLLSTNEVKIIVKNDGSVASCEKSGPFTMIVNYQWLQASSNSDIVNTMLPVFAQMLSG